MRASTIGLVGLGLIGSSIARALRGSNVKLIGYSRSEQTVKQALSLAIIDQASTDLELLSSCDMVILCTPLASYTAIVQQLHSILPQQCVITDVGSVKSSVGEVLVANMPGREVTIVPAHPIAGTEKSGVDAGFSTLFQGKKCIITPMKKTSKQATECVAALWQKMGAHIEYLDADRHDDIYARVSHSVQCLSFITNLVLKELCQDIATHAEDHFKRFMRLAGSNPIMWCDIFIQNQVYIISKIQGYHRRLATLYHYIESGDEEALFHAMRMAQNKRIFLQSTLSANDDFTFVRNDRTGLSADIITYLDSMPTLVATIIMNALDEDYVGYATGTGFRDITENILIRNQQDAAFMVKHRQESLTMIEQLQTQIQQFISSMSDEDALLTLLEKAQQRT